LLCDLLPTQLFAAVNGQLSINFNGFIQILEVKELASTDGNIGPHTTGGSQQKMNRVA
jgi:hypothetical protein